jgi:hypothetical protein
METAGKPAISGTELVTVKAIAIQGKKIIVGANMNDSLTQNGQFVLTRFKDDGTLDKSLIAMEYKSQG